MTGSVPSFPDPETVLSASVGRFIIDHRKQSTVRLISKALYKFVMLKKTKMQCKFSCNKEYNI